MNNPVDQTLAHLRKHLSDYCSPWCKHSVSLVRPLPGGLTNRSYLLQSQGERYVLRINAKNHRQLDLDRRAEIEILQAVGEIGVATELVYADPAEGFLVTKFVDGDPWQRHMSGTTDTISQIADLLKTIHQLDGGDRVMDVRGKSAKYWQAINADGKRAEKLRAIEQKVQAFILWAENENRSPCLCHNDLLAENIIVADDNRLVAIDWEYAAMGDPYFDLAVVVEGHELTPFFERQLLSDYLGCEPSAAEMRRLQYCRIEYAYLELLWYAVQSSSSPILMADQLFEERLINLDQRLSTHDSLDANTSRE